MAVFFSQKHVSCHEEKHQRSDRLIATATGNPTVDKEEDLGIDRKWNLKFPLPSTSCFSRCQRMSVSDAQAGNWGQASLKGNTILSLFTLLFFLFCLILLIIVNSCLWSRQTVKNSFFVIVPSPRGSPPLIYDTVLSSHHFHIFLCCFPWFSQSITQQSMRN